MNVPIVATNGLTELTAKMDLSQKGVPSVKGGTGMEERQKRSLLKKMA